MSKFRSQLTLFTNQRESIEKVREEYNGVQYGLILTHVILCREDRKYNS